MATPFASRKYVDTSVAGLFDGVEYDSTNKRIIFKHGSTQKAYVDATAFIKDGMVDTVSISSGNLVITFNTDAGKEAISIPLTDIFNPANYYDKTAADGRYVQKETGKGLSTEDYTGAEKTKLEGVEAGAQANVIETVKVNGTALTPSSKAVDISVPDAQIQSDWSQSDSTKKDFIKNKPTIPAAVSVDATLTQQGAAADAKATGDALRSGFTPWAVDTFPPASTFVSCVWDTGDSCWKCTLVVSGQTYVVDMIGAQDALSITDGQEITLVRHLITPTKTSQLENDGDGVSPFAKVSQLPDVSGLATKAELPYPFARVAPAEAWAFSGDTEGFAELSVSYSDNEQGWYLNYERGGFPGQSYPIVPGDGTETSITFGFEGETWSITATRSNVLTVTPRTVATYTAGTTAAAFEVAVGTGVSGAARDCVLVVDCTASGAVAPTVIWPSNFHPRGDAEEIAPVAGVRNVFYISEYYATDEFVVGGWHEEVA